MFSGRMFYFPSRVFFPPRVVLTRINQKISVKRSFITTDPVDREETRRALVTGDLTFSKKKTLKTFHSETIVTVPPRRARSDRGRSPA